MPHYGELPQTNLHDHDDPVEPLVDLQHVSVVDLVMVDSVLGDGAHVFALPASRRHLLALDRRVAQGLGDVVQDAVHVRLAEEQVANGVDLVQDLLEPNLVGWKKLELGPTMGKINWGDTPRSP